MESRWVMDNHSRGRRSNLRSGSLLFEIAILLISGAVQSIAADSPKCQAAISAFLKSPDHRGLAALSNIESEACWATMGSSNTNLSQLNLLVSSGNPWAAEYLSSHLRNLDGGNLEDGLSALGEFSEHDMERLLSFAHQGLLPKHELTDSVTMLPLSLSDQPRAQLQVLNLRRAKLVEVRRTALARERVQALSALDDFIRDVKSKNPDVQ